MHGSARGKSWPEIVGQAVAYCHKHGLGLLVVDPWDRWTGLKGDAEKSAGPIIEALDPLLRAADTDLAVLVNAHQRKAPGLHGEAVRGSNALTGGADVVVELERPSEKAGLSGRARVLRAVSRFSSTPEEIVGELTEDGTGYEARGELDDYTVQVQRQKVLEAIEALDWPTAAEVAERAEVGKATAAGHLKKLLDGGLVESKGKGVKNDPKRWKCVSSDTEGKADETNSESNADNGDSA